MYPFLVDHLYSKKDIYRIINLPESTKGGNWDTGYATYENDFYLFVNIGFSGRRGHNYDNYFLGSLLHWYAKVTAKFHQPLVQKMLNPEGYIYIFYRYEANSPYFYAGTGRPYSWEDSSPVQITWQIIRNTSEVMITKEESEQLIKTYTEEAKASSCISTIEQNPSFRSACLKYHGYTCVVCGFDFHQTYGDHGRNYTHVHCVVPLSEINSSYKVDPIKDLRPVCPNCHSMLHRHKPSLSVDELTLLIESMKLGKN